MTEQKLLNDFSLPELSESERQAIASEPARERFDRLDRATYSLSAPVCTLDARALAANADSLVSRAQGMPIRVASKSVRSVEVLRAVLERPGFEGILAFTLAEAIHLVRSGVSDDVVVAYPTTDQNALRELASDERLATAISIMVDHPSQLAYTQQVLRSVKKPHQIRLCLDIDASLRVGGAHIGARRSPIHSPAQARAAAEVIGGRRGFKLVGVMSYEAQIAGMTDSNPAIRAMKQASIRELAKRRSEVIAAIREVAELEFVNGGGTGSIESTRAESAVTEVAAGSGLYGPHLFDHYQSFTPTPAVHFALDVVRAPADRFVTVLGGGWIASGVPGQDRLPLPVWPEGLKVTGTEGAGEVQTPLTGSGALPHIGERVWFRHTKAGEITEHTNELIVVDGDRAIGTVSTYRGEGHAFL